jgi:hypothetical protein
MTPRLGRGLLESAANEHVANPEISFSRLTYAQNSDPPDFMRVFMGISVWNG